MTGVESTAQCTTSNFFPLSLSSFKATLSPKAPGDHKKRGWGPPSQPPSQPLPIRTHQPTPHCVYLSIQWVWTAGGCSGWATLSLRLCHTASQPGAIEVPCLHNGVTNRCPFSKESVFWKKRMEAREREREKKVLGEATTYVRCLEYVQFIQASSHKSPISHFFFFFWLFRRVRRKKEENNKSLLKGLYREFGVLFSSILVDGVNSLSRSEYRPKSRYCLDVRCFSPLRAPSISCASHSYMCSHMCKQQMSCLGD